jgi:hypothetical protein
MESEPCAQLEDGMTSSVVKVCPHCFDLDLEHDCIPSDIDTKRTEPCTLTSVVTAAEEGCRGCRVLRFAVKLYIDEGQASEACLVLELCRWPHPFVCFVELKGITIDCVELFQPQAEVFGRLLPTILAVHLEKN